MQGETVLYSMFTQPLLQLGLKQVLSDMPNCTYHGEIEDVEKLRVQLGMAAADAEVKVAASVDAGKVVVVVDYHPGDDDLETTIRSLRSDFNTVGFLVFLPMLSDESAVIRAMRWGADGYLLHTATPDVVVRAIREIAQGRSFLQTQVTPIVLAEMRRPRSQAQLGSIAFDLTDRERMMLQLAADGLGNVQIADILGLAEKTVRNAWSHLFEKIGMPDRTQAVLWAIRSGQADLR